MVELLIVLVLLVALAGILVPIFGNVTDDAAMQTTQASLVAIRDAVVRSWTDTKYVSLPGSGGSPPTEAEETERFHIRWLFNSPVSGVATSDFDPDSRIGWNGPYLTQFTGRYAIDDSRNLTATYGSDNDPSVLDSFTGTPIVVQVVGASTPYDVRIVSAGPNGIVDIDPTTATSSLESEGGMEAIGDDLYVSFVLR